MAASAATGPITSLWINVSERIAQFTYPRIGYCDHLTDVVALRRATSRLARLLFAGFALSCLAATPANAIDGAALQREPSGLWHLVLSSEMTAGLRDSFPEFELWPDSLYDSAFRGRFHYAEHESPFSQIRDLNGDGFEDVVLDGRIDSHFVLVLLRSQGNRYEARGLKRVRHVGSTSMRPGKGLSLDPPVSPHDTRPMTATERSRRIWWNDPSTPDIDWGVEPSDSLRQLGNPIRLAIRCFWPLHASPDSTRAVPPERTP